ncbi:MAG: hypothetical protein ABI584_12565 [Acidobacteriota bacterium]
MHDGGWLGMGGMGSYWLVPVLLVVLVVFALLLFRRSRDGR